MKLQNFDYLMLRADSLGKTLLLVKIEDRRRRGQQRMRWLHDIINSINMSLGKLWGTVKGMNSLLPQLRWFCYCYCCCC